MPKTQIAAREVYTWEGDASLAGQLMEHVQVFDTVVIMHALVDEVDFNEVDHLSYRAFNDDDGEYLEENHQPPHFHHEGFCKFLVLRIYNSYPKGMVWVIHFGHE